MSSSYIRNEKIRLTEELSLLKEWDEEELAAIFLDIGFSCDLCAKCCTTGFNGHVFLLDKDAAWVQVHYPQYLIPAPEFELMDGEGLFYVSGYALKAEGTGDCPFLENCRCRIYEDRFSICRIYPYMLHREPDQRKKLVFRQISGLNEHGEYHRPITREEALRMAVDTIAYESAWLEQMIAFFSAADELFTAKGFSHIRKAYDHRVNEFRKGAPVQVCVWFQEHFTRTIVRCDEYQGFGWP